MKEFWKKVLVRLGVVAVVIAVLAAAFGIGIWWVKKQNPQNMVKASTVKAKVVTESLGFYNGKEKVDGTVYRPQETGKDLPCIIYCQNTEHGDRWCRDLAARGFVTYSFELGEGEKSRIAAVKTAVKTLRDNRFTDKKRVFILAEGNGCPTACAAAFDMPDKTAGLILVSPGFNPLETFPKARRYRKQILIVDSSLGITANLDEIVSYAASR